MIIANYEILLYGHIETNLVLNDAKHHQKLVQVDIVVHGCITSKQGIQW